MSEKRKRKSRKTLILRDLSLFGSILSSSLGGERGIRTPGTVARTPHFECGPIDHSGISPIPRPGNRDFRSANIDIIFGFVHFPAEKIAESQKNAFPGVSIARDCRIIPNFVDDRRRRFGGGRAFVCIVFARDDDDSVRASDRDILKRAEIPLNG